MLAPETPPALYDQLWACLKERKPANLAAQIVLYQNCRSDRKIQQWLEASFVVQSGGAMSRLLGVPAPKQREAAAAKNPPAADPYRLAEQFWSPELAAAIERRLRTLEAFSDDSRLVALAGTLPSPAVRTALLRTLQRHWDEGPKGLESLVAADGPAIEPGFLLLVKMLPRKDAGGPAAGKDPRARDANRAVPGPSRRKWRSCEPPSNAKSKPRKNGWSSPKALVRTLCERFYAAARAKPNSDRMAEGTADDRFPVKLHPNADVVAVYRLDWPEELDGKIAAAPFLRVRYVRIEQKARPDRLLAYYRRQLPDCEEHVGPDAAWLDSLAADKDQAGARSVDVLLAKSSAAAPGLSDQEQELTVSILTVECEGIAKRSPLALDGQDAHDQLLLLVGTAGGRDAGFRHQHVDGAVPARSLSAVRLSSQTTSGLTCFSQSGSCRR